MKTTCEIAAKRLQEILVRTLETYADCDVKTGELIVNEVVMMAKTVELLQADPKSCRRCGGSDSTDFFELELEVWNGYVGKKQNVERKPIAICSDCAAAVLRLVSRQEAAGQAVAKALGVRPPPAREIPKPNKTLPRHKRR